MEGARRLGRRLADAWRDHPLWCAFALYVLAVLAVTDPLARHLATALPSGTIDPGLSTWILWWNAQALPLTRAWWDAPIFHPSPGSIALSETYLGLAPFTTPLQWLGAEPQVAYNVALLVSFPLCALGAFLLCFELTGRRDAAFLGGLAFGFAPLRMAHLGHLQVLSAYWMPVALLGLHRYARTRRTRDLALFAAAWLLQALCNGYLLFYFSVLVAVWLVWFLRAAGERPALGRVVAAWGLAAACLLPLLLGYRSTHATLGLERSRREVQGYSADVLSFARVSPRMAWSLPAVAPHGDGELFPGRTVTVLFAIPLLAAPFVAPWRRPRRWQWTALGVAAALGAVAVTPVLFGPWRWEVDGRLLVSVSAPHKALGLALMAMAAFIAGTAPVARAWQGRSRLGFYLLAAALMALLCMGPVAHVAGEPFWWGAPYSWLMALPGFAALRAPTRFAMPLVLAMAAAASLVFARFVPAGRRAWSWTALCAVGILADGWVAVFPLAPAPARSALLEADGDRDVPVLELPMLDARADPLAAWPAETAAMFRSMRHRHPVVNGYSGHFPPHYDSLRMGLLDRDAGVVDALAARGPLDVRVDETAPGGPEWTALLRRHPGVSLLGSAPGESLFRVAARAHAPLLCDRTLAVRDVRTTPQPELAPLAHDGDWSTRWLSYPQDGREEVTIDLDGPNPVAGIVLGLGRYTTDFPRRLLVETSLDGTTWREAWRGPAAGEAVRGALARPRQAPIELSWPAHTLRHLRLRQLGSDPIFSFAIAELTVCAP